LHAVTTNTFVTLKLKN